MTAEAALTIAVEDPSQPEIIALLRDGEAYSATLYPAESNHHMLLGALRAANVRFLVVRDAHGRAVGPARSRFMATGRN
jgi:putative acetyltransferase